MLTPAWLLKAAICAVLICCTIVESRYGADKILHLPGQPDQIDFQQFAGYISVDDEYQQRSLFYYFVEAEIDPASKPLVLWLDGGPSCSSVGRGAFTEHGPFRPSGKVLVKNNFSWNKEANMLYLESPAGVGFSYSTNKSFYSSVNFEITAQDNLVFLRNWFKRFPEYQNTDLYIAGEGLAGHFVPELAELIVQSNMKCNLKGIALGNPLLDLDTDLNSRAEYFWSHGLISDATFKLLDFCNLSKMFRESQNNKSHIPAACTRVLNQASSEISLSVNIDAITQDICLSTLAVGTHPQFHHLMKGGEKIDVCLVSQTIEYLNRKDVQNAIHAQLVGVANWSICNRDLHREPQDEEMPTVDVLGSLVKSGIRVMVYSGDQDGTIPLIGTRKLVYGLAKELGLNTTAPYRAWFEGRQVGGWTQVYSDLLSYATIRGASHQAPLSQPQRSLLLFSSFLGGKPLPNKFNIA